VRLQGAVAGYTLGPLLYSRAPPPASTATAIAPSSASAVGPLFTKTVHKTHRLWRAGVVTRPVLMATMFGLAGMVLAPTLMVGAEVRAVFKGDVNSR
jgi:hypothetical protein